jgi:hypothetical protein
LQLSLVHFVKSPIEWRSGVFLINQAHELKIERRFTCRLPVKGGPIETDKFTLTANAESWMVGLNQIPLYLNRIGQLFFSATPIPS